MKKNNEQIDSYQLSVTLLKSRVSNLENILSGNISYLYRVAIQKELTETKKDLSLLEDGRKGKTHEKK